MVSDKSHRNNSPFGYSMSVYLYIISVFLVMACSTSEEKKIVTWESWKGLPATEIEKHPYFKHLKVTKIRNEQGPETWIYKDQTPFPTSSYCTSVGGCQGRPFYNCENAFSVQEGIIMELQQSGNCPGIKTIEVKK